MMMKLEMKMDLETARKKIDEIDHELLRLIAKRLNLSIRIREFKKNMKMKIRHSGREEFVIKDRTEFFKKEGFYDEEFVRRLFSLIMEKSRLVQSEKK